MPVPGLDPPTSFETYPLVDWVEATMVLEEQAWSRTAILDSFPSGAEPDQAEIEFALAEISRRAAAAPSLYPFRVEHASGVLSRDESVDAQTYDFLALLSFPRAPYRLRKEYNVVNPMFDLLVREAVRNYLGGADAEAVRFGWPTRDGRPETLPKATPWLADKMGLKIVSLAGVDDDDKDAGVDVVAWRPFASGGGAINCILMQNTVQLNFQRKSSDVTPTEWLKLINFGPLPPVGLAVPFVVDPESKIFGKANHSALVIFDRLRICERLEGVDLSSFQEWDEIAEWNASQRRALLEQLASSAAATTGRTKKTTGASSPRAVFRKPRGSAKPRERS